MATITRVQMQKIPTVVITVKRRISVLSENILSLAFDIRLHVSMNTFNVNKTNTMDIAHHASAMGL